MKNNLQDLASERAVLASLCQFGLDSYLEMDFVEESHFTDEMNQLIFSCIYKVVSENLKVELSSILSAANTLGMEEVINTKEEISFVRSLFNFPVHKDNAQAHAAKLAKLKLARDFKKTISLCSKDLDNITGEEDIMDLISKVESPILDATADVYQSSGNKTELIGDEIDEYLEYLSENVSDFVGIPTGFDRYDQAIGGGLRRKCVDLIAARPKVGKSMFGDAVAVNIAKKNIPVLVLDTEMSKKDHWNRMLACLSGVETKRISTGKFTENEIEKEKVTKAAEELKTIPYHYINISGQPFENILGIMRKWIYQHVGFDENGETNDCAIIYDYLKLMDSSAISSNVAEFQVLGFQITKLHNFMVKYDVPCLAFVQLNRDGITKETTDVISGSDRLVWLCTSFSIFKRKSDEEMAEDNIRNGDRKIVTVETRHGEGMQDGNYVSVKMFGSIGKIEEGLSRDEIHNNARSREEGFETDEEQDAIPA
jgi:replicative DNA helicase|tara:strand:- start:340 stop:1788 length:1449 start_codon:yes stop_codon:yes gene_type:complete